MQVLSTLLVLLLAACATTSSDQANSNLTYGMIKSKVKKGRTTQAEIIRIFGSPNIVSKNKKGLEVWTYSRQSTRAKSGGGFGTFGIVGSSSAYSNTSTSSFDFIVTFDKKDIVVDYSVVSAKF